MMATAAIWTCWWTHCPVTTLLDLGGLQDELQELLGVPVDVLTLKDLPAKFRDTVAQEARPV
jgi:Predicted nucleotidyltransferases